MTAIILPAPVCTDGASGDNVACTIPLYSPSDLCDHSSSGVVSWSVPVLHSQAGYYAIVGTVSALVNPFHSPGFVLSVDGHDAYVSGILGGMTGAFFWGPAVPDIPGPFPGTVCGWPYPTWWTALTGIGPTESSSAFGFWLSAGTHVIAVRFASWEWDSVQDDLPLCDSRWAANFGMLTLLAGVPCPGYVYGTPDLPAIRLTINPDAPTGLRLTVPAGKHLRLTVNG